MIKDYIDEKKIKQHRKHYKKENKNQTVPRLTKEGRTGSKIDSGMLPAPNLRDQQRKGENPNNQAQKIKPTLVKIDRL